MTVKNITVAARVVGFAIVCLVGGLSQAAGQEINEEQLKMVVEFLADADRETRAVGLQFVREEMSGAEATKRFAELLPKLSPAAQADLLDALTGRGDATARPAVVELLGSDDSSVRASVIRALGILGNTEDVATLVGSIARGSDEEKQIARASLVKLPGKDVNAAIVTAIKQGDSMDRVELLAVLAGRNAKETLPEVLTYSEDRTHSVRLAALGALRILADEEQTPQLIEILKKAKAGVEKQKAELALLAVCGISGEASVPAVTSGLQQSDPATRMALLRALARAGGEQALKTVAAGLKDGNEQVADEAARMLSAWQDPAVESHLRELAGSDKLRHQILALRGLVRLANPKDDKPANLELLSEVMKLADRPEEKRLVVGSLSRLADPAALKQALSAMDDEGIADEAALAVVVIAENIKAADENADKQQLRTAVEKAKAATKSQTIHALAKELLDALK